MQLTKETETNAAGVAGGDHRGGDRPRLPGARLPGGVPGVAALRPQVLSLRHLLQRVSSQTLPPRQVRNPPTRALLCIDMLKVACKECRYKYFSIFRPVNVDSGYTTPTNCDNNNSNKNMNILMNATQSKPSNSVSSKLERTKISCTGTLQKVKRVYL